MNRTATVLAATVAALLLSAAPAYADAPVVTDPWSGEVVDCFDEPIEYEPGVWVCTSVEDAAAWGLDTPVEEAPDPVVETPDPVEVERAEAEWTEPEADEPAPVIVEDNGGWGWSDARESYTA